MTDLQFVVSSLKCRINSRRLTVNPTWLHTTSRCEQPGDELSGNIWTTFSWTQSLPTAVEAGRWRWSERMGTIWTEIQTRPWRGDKSTDRKTTTSYVASNIIIIYTSLKWSFHRLKEFFFQVKVEQMDLNP